MSAFFSVLLAGLLAVPCPVSASDHFAIIADLANTKNDAAIIDVTSSLAVVVQYRVFPAGSGPAPVTLNSNLFGASPDLFAFASSLPALILVHTDPDVPSQAALRQRKLEMAIPSIDKSLGTVFAIPVGDLGTGAELLIGNPSNLVPVVVDVFPTPSSPPTSVSIEPDSVAVVPITVAQTRVLVISEGGFPILVQFAILGKGQEFTMTMVPPI